MKLYFEDCFISDIGGLEFQVWKKKIAVKKTKELYEGKWCCKAKGGQNFSNVYNIYNVMPLTE